MMWDFTFGGVYDDAFSATLPMHLWGLHAPGVHGLRIGSGERRAFGFAAGAFCAVAHAARSVALVVAADPGHRVVAAGDDFLRGSVSNSAVFLVFLGAFYPIMLNTVFGVRSVDARLFEAAAMLGCTGTAQFSFGDPAWRGYRVSSTACASACHLRGS